MTTTNRINSNFYQIAVTDANGNVTGLEINGLSIPNADDFTLGGGANGQVLSTDGNGNLSWVTGASSNVSYANTANISNTANSVALANVVGAGNISGLNLNGNGAQYLGGNGAWVGLPTSVANATYANTAGSSNTANISNTANSVALANVVGAGNISGLNLNGNVATVLSGDGTWIPQANSNGTSGVAQIIAGNGITLSPTTGLGIVTVSANTVANATYANTSGIANTANTANVANGLQSTVGNTKITGGTTGQMLITDGTGNLSFATPNDGTVTSVGVLAGTGVSVSGSPITSNGNITVTNTGVTSIIAGTNVTVSGANGAVTVNATAATNLNYATETVTLVTHTVGAYTHDLLTSSIVFSTVAATGGVTVAYRGNTSTTVNTLVGIGQSITATYVMTTGATGYAVTGITVDGTSQTINWAGGTTPSVVANTKMSYTFTLIKTAANTYTVLGSATRFG